MSGLWQGSGALIRLGLVLAVLAACWLPGGAAQPGVAARLALTATLALGFCAAWAPARVRPVLLLAFWAALTFAGSELALAQTGGERGAFWAAVIAVWLGAWLLVALVADLPRRRGVLGLVAPLLFGATVLWAWETIVRALNVPRVILPAPSEIAGELAASTGTLWIDLVQTFGRGALSGFVIGCGAAFLFALVVDRYPFLKKGLLPVGNFLAALPIIGTAPIFVMWFGFDWPSKAAVVVAMVFFPMLVNTVQGLAATDAMQRDLMHTYSASWGQTLMRLRLPAAMPFIFNGLKICATLALIGAIVAEFFGSPTYGMGFRISTEVGRLQLDMVWAEIAVAAALGSAFYGVWALLERRVTFWHPSQRSR
ncbi:MAG: ABC transporter permease [Rhodobacteraceae bacterium]|nr:ABC transporter permease [Paracoccaceae bacterium]